MTCRFLPLDSGQEKAYYFDCFGLVLILALTREIELGSKHRHGADSYLKGKSEEAETLGLETKTAQICEI